MTVSELLEELIKQKVVLWLEGNNLAYRAPKGVLTKEQLQWLGQYKDEVMAQIRERDSKSIQYSPLSYGQRALWFQHQMAPTSPAYNIPFVARIVSQASCELLKGVFEKLIDRHPMLRTTYDLENGTPRMQIHGLLNPIINQHDVKGISEAELFEMVCQKNREPFDLANGPLIRIHLFERSAFDQILLITIHHIACDGWSLGVILRDLKAICEATVNGGPFSLPHISYQYTDFVRQQSEFIESKEGEELLNYWKRQLSAEIPVLDLPLDNRRLVSPNFDGSTYHFSIDKDLYEAVSALAKNEAVTVYGILLSAFQVLLMRYGSQEDIAVGTPTLGRNSGDHEQVVGLFINQVVMRGNLSGNLPFRDFLKQNQRVILDALRHQDYPFPLLVEKLQPRREAGYHPIFQVLFNYMKQAMIGSIDRLLDGTAYENPLDFGFLKLKPYPIPQQEGQFDLALEVLDNGQALLSSFRYRTDIFHVDTIARMTGHFRTLLASIVTDPEQRIWELPIEERAEQEDFILRSNLRPTVQLKSVLVGPLGEQIAEHARSTSLGLAVVDKNDSWTYEELEKLSNRLADYLRINGIKKGDVVAIYAHRSASLVLSLLGVLKTGAAFLILDSRYPIARLTKMLELSSPRGWLQMEAAGPVGEELRTFVEASKFQCFLQIPQSKGAIEDLLRGSSPEPSRDQVLPDDTAYVIFTSGTTGQPKGIIGTHGPLAHFLAWHCKEFDLKRSDRFSMLAGLSHDPLLRDILTPLWLGATVHIPDQDTILVPANLRSWMIAQQITVAHMTPALGQLLSQGIDGKNSGDGKLPFLRYVFFGGDTLTWRHVEKIREIAPEVKCVNFYGATETPQAMGYQVINAHERNRLRESIPLGKGIEGVQLLVVNPACKLAGISELGEIYVRTPYLAKGYLKDEVLTHERFIPNPFNDVPGDCVYRTGDLGRYLPDGRVMFCGRADSQVSIRGFRVEVKEIEATLAMHSNIRDCTVVARNRDSGDKYLVAYVVGYDHKNLDIAHLKEYVGKALPDYMIPSIFVQLDELPLTLNGKIDVTLLPEPAHIKGFGRSNPYEPPRYPTEELLVEIWAQVLEMPHIGVHDNFFELGGHSLMVTQVISRIRDLFHLELPLSAIFETLTVARLAERLQAQMEVTDNSAVALPPITPVAHSGDLPLSYSQERMWFLQQLIPDGTAYNMGSAVIIDGVPDIGHLKETFQLLVKRHESLRTTFGSRDGQPFQRIASNPDFLFRIVDLKHLPLADRQSEALRVATEDSRKPFYLDSGPLLRINIYRISEDVHILHVSIHHIITDLWSSGILWREFLSVYRQLSEVSSLQLPEKQIDYADFAAWQRNWLTGKVLEHQVAYWKEQLAGLQVLELPTDRPRPAVFSGKGARTEIPLPDDLIEQLKSFSANAAATPFMVLLAAFYILLWRYTGQEDIAIGVPIANRHRTEIEEVVGTFVNTLVLRISLTDDLSFRHHVLSVRDMALSAYAHQDLPFERLVGELHPSRDPSHSPLVQVMFNLANAPVAELNVGGLTFHPIAMDRGSAQFDLAMAIDLDIRRVVFVEYATDLFDSRTVQHMLDHYLAILRLAIHSPDLPIAGISFLEVEEARVVLEEWNQTSIDYPSNQPAARLFEDRVIQHPEATAVICGSEKISYGELNRRANQLAQYLLDLGVVPDSFVGIFLERTIDMVVSLLGIMKSGAAYLPMDPAFPEDRIAFMLKDSRATVVITQSSLLDELPEIPAHVVCIDTEGEKILQLCGDNLERNPDPESLAYIIYTSGSTGLPKGVQISHRALVNFLQSMAHEPGLTSNDTILAVTTLSFDIAGLEMFLPLIVGGKIALASRETVTDGHLLAEAMKSSGATVLQATPASWRMLIESGWQGDKRLKALVGGEALPRELAAQLFSRCGELWNMYGPTETTIWSTISRLTNVNEPILIGRPIANTTVYILDKHLRPLPIGVPGELHIGGEGLARGYLNRDTLTREKFISNPFGLIPGGRIYKTGDLARYRPDGSIECLGRLDQQVKVRGFRIELGEIETALADHPGVNRNVVVAREDKPGEKRLVAYIVPDKDTTISPSEIRAHLKRTLPDYMIPSAFVAMDELPLTPNGKINRLALPVPDSGQLEDSREFVAPCSPMEETLVTIWKDVLELDHISVHDNFFEIGGHSLLSMQVISRLEKKTGLRINPRELIYQTLGQLATSIEQQARDLTPGEKQENKNGLWQAIKSRLFRLQHKK